MEPEKERIAEIVRKHFRELLPEETCQMQPEDYEPPDDEEQQEVKLWIPIVYFGA